MCLFVLVCCLPLGRTRRWNGVFPLENQWTSTTRYGIGFVTAVLALLRLGNETPFIIVSVPFSIPIMPRTVALKCTLCSKWGMWVVCILGKTHNSMSTHRCLFQEHAVSYPRTVHSGASESDIQANSILTWDANGQTLGMGGVGTTVSCEEMEALILSLCSAQDVC